MTDGGLARTSLGSSTARNMKRIQVPCNIFLPTDRDILIMQSCLRFIAYFFSNGGKAELLWLLGIWLREYNFAVLAVPHKNNYLPLLFFFSSTVSAGVHRIGASFVP